MRTSQISTRTILLLTGAIGLVQIAGYYLAGATVRSDGGFAIGQPDTLLYCQAARRIAEGFPFSFSSGSAVSTGTTSVLYPFVLAIPYALGATGDSLFLAGFVLNAQFYMMFLLGWASTIAVLFKERPNVSVLASVLMAAFGPFAFCALAQSDTGLWMGVSAWIAYGFVLNRRVVYAPLLLVAPWIRPEGMILVFAYTFCLVISCVRNRELKQELLLAFAFLLSSVSVFALNYGLTGAFQFSSVAQKGYFKLYPFAQAVQATAIDGMALLKDLLCGSLQKSPRIFFFVPIAGAVFIWLGVLTRQWRGAFSWRIGCWYLAILGGLFTVAMSGWQDINLDRYVMWGLPSVIILMAEGVAFAESKLPKNGMSFMSVLIPCGYSIVASFVLMNMFHTCSQSSDRIRSFIRSCAGSLPEEGSVGVTGLSGIAYELGNRQVKHLAGIYSPEFMFRDGLSKFELLKTDPSQRVDYWFVSNDELRRAYGEKSRLFDGDIEYVGPDGWDVRKAKWDVYDAGRADPGVHVPDVKLMAKVDVGFEPSERAAEYELITTYDQPDFEPRPVIEKLNGTLAFDGGRMISGGDEMTVRLTPGRDAYVVMRTVQKFSTYYSHSVLSSSLDFTFKSPIRLQMLVDGAPIELLTLNINEEGFSDVCFKIPASAITRDSTRVCLLGEHVTCGYWFYQ